MRGTADNIFDRNYATGLLTKKQHGGSLKSSNGKYTVFVPLTSTWPHLNSDVGLEEGEY